MKPLKGYITDIPTLLVGHYTDIQNRTGCTAIIAPDGAVIGSDVRGGAPGTREIALTKPGQAVEKAHAVVLSGGSAFGLASASGVMNYLESQNIGFDVGVAKVPIVCAAVIFDLDNGGAAVRPDEAAGYFAAQTATAQECRQGQVGGGAGATVGKFFGAAYRQAGGLGSATVTLADGLLVSALVVVNALGDIYDEAGHIVCGACENGVFLNTQTALLTGQSGQALRGANTTIGVIATNAALTKEQANRLAALGHNGFARAIRPVHTMMDGDTLFALSAGEKEANFDVIGVAAQEAVFRAIQNAVAP